MTNTTAAVTEFVTHAGQFHADEVMACAIVMLANPVGVTVTRTRDPKITVAAPGRIVADVGGVFDHATRCYDHHQRGRAEKWPNGIEKSSAGLVWTYEAGSSNPASYLFNMSTPVREAVRDRVIMPIDAHDNGQALFEGGGPAFPGVTPMTLSAVVGSLNSLGEEAGFSAALGICQEILKATILAAREEERTSAILETAITTCAGSPVLLLPEFCPQWAARVETVPEVMYVIFQNQEGTWMCQAVPGKEKFSQRRPLPAAWGGLRDETLQEKTGVPDAVFCHPGLFICGAGSREGALALAYLALGIGQPSDLEDR